MIRFSRIIDNGKCSRAEVCFCQRDCPDYTLPGMPQANGLLYFLEQRVEQAMRIEPLLASIFHSTLPSASCQLSLRPIPH